MLKIFLSTYMMKQVVERAKNFTIFQTRKKMAKRSNTPSDLLKQLEGKIEKLKKDDEDHKKKVAEYHRQENVKKEEWNKWLQNKRPEALQQSKAIYKWISNFFK